MAEGVTTDSNLPLFSAEEVQYIVERSTMLANFLNAIPARKIFYLLTLAYGVDDTRRLGCV